MKNKLGISEYKLSDIEKILTNVKLNLIDENFTFNKSELNFEYLKKLNDFLFSDIYDHEELKIRKMSNLEYDTINDILNKINYLCINFPNNIKEILECLKEMWYLQPFTIGNTRTLIAYLKILNCAFLLDLNINVNEEIISTPATFNLNNFVNQKRLTKDK